MKKVIRITEEDLRKIINRIVENNPTSPVDIAKDAVMLGVFGSDSQPTTNSNNTNQSNSEMDVINAAKQKNITNGQWSRNQSTSTEIQLWYIKSPNDKKWVEFMKTNAPKNIKRTNGKWSISNNKLIITD